MNHSYILVIFTRNIFPKKGRRVKILIMQILERYPYKMLCKNLAYFPVNNMVYVNLFTVYK